MSFRASGNVERPGVLLNAGAGRMIPVDSAGTTMPAMGLQVMIGSASPVRPIETCAATLEIEAGRPIGGAIATRRCTLTPAGLWLSLAGWDNVQVQVREIAPGARVSYAWTVVPPPTTVPMWLVQNVVAAPTIAPEGAVSVAVTTADAAWVWRTVVGGATYNITAPQAADGLTRPVLGAWYVPSAANTVMWELQPL